MEGSYARLNKGYEEERTYLKVKCMYPSTKKGSP